MQSAVLICRNALAVIGVNESTPLACHKFILAAPAYPCPTYIHATIFKTTVCHLLRVLSLCDLFMYRAQSCLCTSDGYCSTSSLKNG